MQNIPLIKLGIVFLPAVLLLRMADTPSSPSRAAAKRTQPEPPTSHDREKGPLNYLSSTPAHAYRQTDKTPLGVARLRHRRVP